MCCASGWWSLRCLMCCSTACAIMCLAIRRIASMSRWVRVCYLMHLPIAFFHARQVGNTVARVRELDTIREFITSSALTLVIDLFFTVVFFAVMYYYSPTLTWIVLGSIPLYILLSLSITPVLRSEH